MNVGEPAVCRTGALSAAARQRLRSCRGEPLFIAEWARVVFIHLEVDPVALAREVPFELDLWNGRAFVSLVAFTMRGMRSRFLGAIGRWLCAPIATHGFLNLRTYVRCHGEAGIYFVREWLDNRLSVHLGQWPFGLPYCLGKLDCNHNHATGRVWGTVQGVEGVLRYSATLPSGARFQPCEAGTRDEFLLERYTAFTRRGGASRYFRIWHPPWPQSSVEAEVIQRSLFDSNWPFLCDALLVGANFSPGVRGVRIGWPHRFAVETGLRERCRR